MSAVAESGAQKPRTKICRERREPDSFTADFKKRVTGRPLSSDLPADLSAEARRAKAEASTFARAAGGQVGAGRRSRDGVRVAVSCTRQVALKKVDVSCLMFACLALFAVESGTVTVIELNSPQRATDETRMKHGS